MSTLTLIIVVVFLCGYLCIAIESLTKVNKAAIALLMLVVCWTLFIINPEAYIPDVIQSVGGKVQ
ncbi:MAG: sodium:proton antiporter, partial [Prevotella sp.]|nr:sodium:proton antiporter [Prevotella sp.]